MKTTLFVILTATCIFSSPMRAEEKAGPTVTITSYIADKYLGFQTGNPLFLEPVSQSAITVGFANGIFADLAVSRSLSGAWDDGSLGNELDYTLGWNGQVTKDLILRAGVTYFDEPDAFTLGRGDILNPWLKLSRKFTHFSLIARYDNFTPLPGSSFDGGHLISLGVGTSHSFFKKRLEVSTITSLVYDTGTIGSGTGFLARGNISANWHVTPRFTLNFFGMNWYVPMVSDKRSTDAMFMTGVTYRFN